MNMLDIHLEAIANNSATYHEFLARYSNPKKVVYGFVEGKSDPCFYRGFIENKIPADWEVELWPAGNKKQVYQMHHNLDWQRFPKNRICFFVDRDLSDFIPEELANDSNIYVTDGYSIETDIVNKGVCKRILIEICGMGEVNHQEIDDVCELFQQELKKFAVALTPLMAWILFWRRRKVKLNLSDISMQHLFYFESGCIQEATNPKGKNSLEDYIHSQCKVPHDPAISVDDIKTELESSHNFRLYTRGKYLFWFLIEFCISVRNSAPNFFRSLTAAPRMDVSLSAKNGLTVIGNRARLPQSLCQFLEATFCQYIATRQNLANQN